MTRKILAAVVAVGLAAPVAALACPGGCGGQGQTAENGPKPAEVTVAQVAELKKAHKPVVVLDANSPDFRAQYGVVPGAKLLTSMDYEPAKELPAAKDSKLVFYCANSHCGASHFAATKAMEAGYTDVSVMPDGLLGWKSAGQPTEAVKRPQS